MENNSQTAHREHTTAQQAVSPQVEIIGQVQMPQPQLVSDRKKSTAALLCFFLGGLGAHRYYAGKVGTGVLMFFTLGGVGIWSLIDFIRILVGSFKDYNNLPLR